MACFDDIIAVRNNCSNTVPTSGLYIDDIAIDISLLNDWATQSFDNGEDLLDKKLTFARQLMLSQIKTQFSDRFKTRSVIAGDRIGHIQENLEPVSAVANFKGIEIEMCNHNTYLDFYVNRIDLLLNYTGNLTLNVWDLHQGRIIDTIAVTGIVAGETKTIHPNKTYKSDKQELHLFIGYDASAVDSYKVSVGTNGCASCGNGGIMEINPYTRVSSRVLGLADTPVDENLDGVSDTGGLSIIYSLNCNHEDWLCEKANVLAVALLYKTGAEILQHALNEYEHISNSQLAHYDKLKERVMELDEKYKEELGAVLSTLTLPEDDICFLCNQRVKTVISLP